MSNEKKSNGRGGVRVGAGRPVSEKTKLIRVPLGAEAKVKALLKLYKIQGF